MFCNKEIEVFNNVNDRSEIKEEIINSLSSIVTLIEVENKGIDFYKYYTGFNYVREFNPRKVLICNDSCIIVKKLDEFFEKIHLEEFNVYGMIDDFDMFVDSYQFDECRRFIQSFFVLKLLYL